MREIIEKPIREVLQRLKGQARLRRGLLGLAVCGCGMLGIATCGLQLESRAILLAAPLAFIGLALFLIRGASNSYNMTRAANAIDRHYQWKDRIVSAFDFVQKEPPTLMETLHINATAENIQSVRAKDVVTSGLGIADWRNLAVALLCFALWTLPVALWHPTTFQQPQLTLDSPPKTEVNIDLEAALRYQNAQPHSTSNPKSSDAVGTKYLKSQFTRAEREGE